MYYFTRFDIHRHCQSQLASKFMLPGTEDEAVKGRPSPANTISLFHKSLQALYQDIASR